jgi:hypothetical protein
MSPSFLFKGDCNADSGVFRRVSVADLGSGYESHARPQYLLVIVSE